MVPEAAEELRKLKAELVAIEAQMRQLRQEKRIFGRLGFSAERLNLELLALAKRRDSLRARLRELEKARQARHQGYELGKRGWARRFKPLFSAESKDIAGPPG